MVEEWIDFIWIVPLIPCTLYPDMQIIKVMVLRRVMAAPRYQYPKAGSKSSHGRGYIGTQCSTAGGYRYIKVWDIKNNAWVTVNNDFFLSRVGWFANDFHEWRSHEWKSLANHLTSDQKIVIHDNECIILFLTRYFISWTHRSATKKHRSLISPLSLGTFFSDLTLWRHHSWSVTSREREALALWRHIRRLFLHAQISAKAIFTSEYQPWISISHHPVFAA